MVIPVNFQKRFILRIEFCSYNIFYDRIFIDKYFIIFGVTIKLA